MPPPLTFEYNVLSCAFPDDESDKELFLQAPGTRAIHHHRHLSRAAFIYWVNRVFDDGEEVWQVVRLDERDNVHKYVYPDMIVVDEYEREYNETFELGKFTRDQRELVLECADEIEYDARSKEEGKCLGWMGRLLERLAGQGLLGREVIDALRDVVPLP